MRFCMSSGVVAEPVLDELFLRLLGVAYVHDAVSPRLVQLSQGWPRLHFSLQKRQLWMPIRGLCKGVPTCGVYRLHTRAERDSSCARL